MDKLGLDKQPLRILSIGAGAIGTYIGGSLALHGNHVTFLEQPQVAAQLSSLRLNLDGVEHQIEQPQIVASLDEALAGEPFDVALFALKSYDTETALAGMADDYDRLPPFLCLSNGVENEVAIAAALGADKMIAGTVTSAIARRGAGDIRLERLRGVGVAAGHPLSERLVAALSDAGLNGELFSSADAMKWSKMLTNLISNATSAILDLPPAEVFANPALFWLEISQLREALAVMAARDFSVVDLPGTPVKALAFAAKSLPLWLSRPLMGQAVGKGRGAKMPSFHIDLHSGRGKSEVSYLNGAVVQHGASLGIPTPANLLLNQTLLALTHGDLAIDAYRHNPARLLSDF